jgi:ATP-binding cassette subfamily C protein/ATP-binding cassette subfamily C protein EexD
MSVFLNLTLFVTPIYSIQVYDRVLSSRNVGTLVLLTLITGVFIALYGFLEYMRGGILMRGGARFNEVLANPVFETALSARLAGRESAANQALKDADTLRDGLSSGTLSSLFDAPWSVVFVALCWFMHPALGVVALIGALLILACAVLAEQATRSGLLDARVKAAEAGRFAQAILRNLEVVRGLGMGANVRAHWYDKQAATVASLTAAGERSSALIALSKSARMGVQAGLLCVGAWLAIDRAISPGVMMAAMIIMSRALAPIEHVVGNWNRIVAFRAAMKHLEDLMVAVPARPRPTALPTPKGNLRAEDLALVSPDGNLILRGVNFSIEAGQALAIIGPSGSGKSSLARALAGIWTPLKGTVRIDGATLSQWQPDSLGSYIGYLPQSVEFLPGTVAENIARLGKPDDEAVIAAARLAGVHETILRFPAGYDTQLAYGGAALSGGQGQRLALARALYGSPRIVLLDEPNANLDADGEAALTRAIAHMKTAGQTVIVITHRPQLLRHVDRVLVLGNGTTKMFGERDEVLAAIAGPTVKAMSSDAMHRERQTRAAALSG